METKHTGNDAPKQLQKIHAIQIHLTHRMRRDWRRANCNDVSVKIVLSLGLGSVCVDSSISLSLIFEGGLVSKSSNEIRGGCPDSRDDCTIISIIVAHSSLRSSMLRGDILGRYSGS